MAFDFDCFPKVPLRWTKYEFPRDAFPPFSYRKHSQVSLHVNFKFIICYFCFVIAASEHMALWTQLLLHSGSLLCVLTSLDWKIPDLTPFSAQFSLYICLILHLLRVNCCALPSPSRSENLRDGLRRGRGTCLKRHSVFLMDDGWPHRFQPNGARSEQTPHSMKHMAGNMPKAGKAGPPPNSAVTRIPQNQSRSGLTASIACPHDPI